MLEKLPPSQSVQASSHSFMQHSRRRDSKHSERQYPDSKHSRAHNPRFQSAGVQV